MTPINPLQKNLLNTIYCLRGPQFHAVIAAWCPLRCLRINLVTHSETFFWFLIKACLFCLQLSLLGFHFLCLSFNLPTQRTSFPQDINSVYFFCCISISPSHIINSQLLMNIFINFLPLGLVHLRMSKPALVTSANKFHAYLFHIGMCFMEIVHSRTLSQALLFSLKEILALNVRTG